MVEPTAASEWSPAKRPTTIISAAMKLVLRELRIHGDKLIAIVKIGLPAGVQGMIFSLTNVMIQSSINSFGATIVAVLRPQTPTSETSIGITE